ncbi:hypothetical protein [Pigmentiphaga litoralis]|uniref:hypothetical protein n=1 Tax=Pigmentiphaga litoralis TaxID=516702 RepID=UPI003B42E04E
MAISNTQRAAMAAVILVGVLAGAAILFSGRDHGHEDGPDDHGHDEPATQTNPVQGERDAVTLTPSGRPAAAPDAAAATPRSGQPGGGPGSSAPAADAHAGDAVRLSPAQLSASGVTIATAGPATVQDATEFPGEIKFNDDMTAHVVPRVGESSNACRPASGSRSGRGGAGRDRQSRRVRHAQRTAGRTTPAGSGAAAASA